MPDQPPPTPLKALAPKISDQEPAESFVSIILFLNEKKKKEYSAYYSETKERTKIHQFSSVILGLYRCYRGSDSSEASSRFSAGTLSLL